MLSKLLRDINSLNVEQRAAHDIGRLAYKNVVIKLSFEYCNGILQFLKSLVFKTFRGTNEIGMSTAVSRRW